MSRSRGTISLLNVSNIYLRKPQEWVKFYFRKTRCISHSSYFYISENDGKFWFTM